MGQARRDKQWPMPEHTSHVWVQSPEDHQPPDPGVVIEWRRWEYKRYALVFVVMHRQGRVACIQRWFAEADVIEAPTRPKSPDAGRWHRGWHGDITG